MGYAVRRDGMLFASGYYVRADDPAGQTSEYVQEAIEYYRNNGLEATVAFYNTAESLDGQWGLTLADENGTLLAAPLAQHLVGTDLKDLSLPRRGDRRGDGSSNGGGNLDQLHIPQCQVLGDPLRPHMGRAP